MEEREEIEKKGVLKNLSPTHSEHFPLLKGSTQNLEMIKEEEERPSFSPKRLLSLNNLAFVADNSRKNSSSIKNKQSINSQNEDIMQNISYNNSYFSNMKNIKEIILQSNDKSLYENSFSLYFQTELNKYKEKNKSPILEKYFKDSIWKSQKLVLNQNFEQKIQKKEKNLNYGECILKNLKALVKS